MRLPLLRPLYDNGHLAHLEAVLESLTVEYMNTLCISNLLLVYPCLPESIELDRNADYRIISPFGVVATSVLPPVSTKVSPSLPSPSRQLKSFHLLGTRLNYSTSPCLYYLSQM